MPPPPGCLPLFHFLSSLGFHGTFHMPLMQHLYCCLLHPLDFCFCGSTASSLRAQIVSESSFIQAFLSPGHMSDWNIWCLTKQFYIKCCVSLHETKSTLDFSVLNLGSCGPVWSIKQGNDFQIGYFHWYNQCGGEHLCALSYFLILDSFLGTGKKEKQSDYLALIQERVGSQSKPPLSSSGNLPLNLP